MLFASASSKLLAEQGIRVLMERDRQRRDRFERRHQLLEGNFRDIVKERVREIFATPEAAERCAIMADSSCNVFKFVVTEIAQYQGARRAFVSGSTRDDVYARIDEEVEPFDLVMQEALTALRGCNDALIRVLPRQDGRPSMRVFRPHECTVIPREDDPSQPAAVYYDQETPKGETVTVVWTEAEHYIVTGAGEVLPAPGASGTTNPFGRLPFVAIHAGLRPDSFWDDSTGEDEVEFTIDYLAGWSAVRHLIHQQSHVQIVVTTSDAANYDPPKKVGAGTLWVMQSGESVEAIDIKSQPGPLIEALERSLAGHMATQGLNPQSLGQNPGQAPPSGLSLYLDRQKVIERRRKLHPALVEAEYALAELYRWAWNRSHAPVEQISEDAEFSVEILEETVVESPSEAALRRKTQLEVFKAERELGMKSHAEQVAEDRGISTEEAEKLLPELQPKPEIFAYDQDNAIATIDQIRAGKGMPPLPGIGHLTVPQLRAEYPEWFATPGSMPTTQAE